MLRLGFGCWRRSTSSNSAAHFTRSPARPPPARPPAWCRDGRERGLLHRASHSPFATTPSQWVRLRRHCTAVLEPGRCWATSRLQPNCTRCIGPRGWNRQRQHAGDAPASSARELRRRGWVLARGHFRGAHLHRGRAGVPNRTGASPPRSDLTVPGTGSPDDKRAQLVAPVCAYRRRTLRINFTATPARRQQSMPLPPRLNHHRKPRTLRVTRRTRHRRLSRALRRQRPLSVISIHNMPILDAVAARGTIRFVIGARRGQRGQTSRTPAHGHRLCWAWFVTSTGTATGNAAAAWWRRSPAGTPLLHITGQIRTQLLDRDLAYIHGRRTSCPCAGRCPSGLAGAQRRRRLSVHLQTGGARGVSAASVRSA